MLEHVQVVGYISGIMHHKLDIHLRPDLQANQLPAVGNGPYPGVLLIPGSGAVDILTGINSYEYQI